MTTAGQTICLALALCCPIVSTGQKAKSCRINYADENQIDYEGRARVGVRGIVLDESSAPIPGACVAVFTEDEHRFITGVRSSDTGRFELPLLRNGHYRLVVNFVGFGVANMKFRKIPEDRADFDLRIHLRFRGVDSTSYIDKN